MGGITMKTFNITEAKAGRPICTRNGRKARIISFNRFNKSGYNVVALLLNANGEETIRSYMNDGKLYKDAQNPDDLMIQTTTHTGWVCMYHTEDGKTVTSSFIYPSAAEARKNSVEHLDCFGVAPILWEE
jgi:hypothetical protein